MIKNTDIMQKVIKWTLCKKQMKFLKRADKYITLSKHICVFGGLCKNWRFAGKNTILSNPNVLNFSLFHVSMA